MIALAALLLGAGGSIAMQSFAQTPPSTPSTISTSTDQSVDQKDQSGNDIETNDDIAGQADTDKSSVSGTHNDQNEQGETANDADGGVNED
ncbi:MAG: hypothetical protein RL641_657 [Candidatus Parcubacteria bacterium]